MEGAHTCPVCNASSSRTIYANARDPITLDSFQVVQCSSCGVAFTKPRPFSLERYYPQKYRGYGRFVTRILRILYRLRVSRWARLKPAGGSVLEVGCGPGLMLAALHERGWRVLGIERNEAVAEMARRALGIDIVATPVEGLPTDARFDLIIMFHVLEHIGDPVSLLKECAKRLVPDGRLIINVPNFSSWQSRFAKSKWLHLDVPRHLVHFTPRTLTETVKRAGLKPTAITFASLEHDPYGWAESAINQVTGSANTLTRFLMGLDPFGPAVLLSALAEAVLLPVAMLLAIVSWIVGQGALMEATAVLIAADK